MNFEKLDVWKRSARLSAELYKKLGKLRDFGFRDQITRSGLSIPSNIAEGMSREGVKEKLQFLSIANGSCAELRTQIYIGLDVGYIENESGKHWLNETRVISSMLKNLSNSIKVNSKA